MQNLLKKKKKLGEMLVDANLLTPEQLMEALRQQKKTGKKLGDILIETKVVESADIISMLGEQVGIPHIWLRKGMVDVNIINIIPYETAKAYQVLPLFNVRDTLTVATCDPQSVFRFDELAKLTGCSIQAVLCRMEDILDNIEEHYRHKSNASEFYEELHEDQIQVVDSIKEEELENIELMAEGSPIVNLVNTVILRAIKDRASDIHIEPSRTRLRIRFRIDGILYEAFTPKLEYHAAVVSRLKIMAGLDIAERRLPQDGRIQVLVKDKFIDLRFSSLHGIFGEKVVLRVLDKDAVILDVNKLGLRPVILDQFKMLLSRPHGLILTTGPTGSGKTTTLYASMGFLNSVEKNLVTIEDPVEYQLEIVNQNQTNEAIGMNFARFLRHVLRQDPDIVMVGEIRDRETAEIAIQAALTGHLVLSTIHTNDASGAITRLLDMGIEPYLITSALTCIIGQRLIRTICSECKSPYFPNSVLTEQLGLAADHSIKLFQGKGCDACYDSGFHGRMGIYELIEVEAELQGLILQNPSHEQLRSYVAQNNITTTRDEGIEKVKEGLTTLEEVNRAVYAGA